MTRRDAPAFSTLMAGLAETFDVVLSAPRTELYYRALEDLPIESLQTAAGRALRECRFFPKPVELRELAGQDGQTAAELAWMALLEAFHDGYDGVSLPDDPITQALVQVYWGTACKAREWWRFCHDAALEAKHKEFVTRYQDYATRPVAERPRLPGGRIFEALEAHRRALIAGTDAGNA